MTSFWKPKSLVSCFQRFPGSRGGLASGKFCDEKSGFVTASYKTSRNNIHSQEKVFRVKTTPTRYLYLASRMRTYLLIRIRLHVCMLYYIKNGC